MVPEIAKAAIESGVAQRPITDFANYHRYLETLISRRLEFMHDVIEQAKKRPKRVVFTDGEHPKILRAAKILVDRKIAHPILLAREEKISERLEELDLPLDKITILHNERSPDFERYAEALHLKRRRNGVTYEDALKLMRSRRHFGPMMVELGDADGMISGLTHYYADTIRPALRIIGTRPDVRRVSGAYILILEDRIFILADTTVNIDPTPEELAEIATLTADLAYRFGIEPRVAMLSFSSFGSNRDPRAKRVRQATQLVKEQNPQPRGGWGDPGRHRHFAIDARRDLLLVQSLRAGQCTDFSRPQLRQYRLQVDLAPRKR